MLLRRPPEIRSSWGPCSPLLIAAVVRVLARRDVPGDGRICRRGPGLPRRERDRERRALHRQLAEPVADRVGEPRAGAGARLVQLGGPVGERRARRLEPRPPVLDRLLGALEQLAPARGTRSAWASTASIVPPCLRLSRSNCASRSSTSSRRPGVASSPRRSGAARRRGRRPRRRRARARSASASSSRIDPGARRAPRPRRPGRAAAPPPRPPPPDERLERRPPATRRAGPRRGAAARARRPARPPPPRSAPPRSISSSSHTSRSSSRSRAPARLAQLVQRRLGRARLAYASAQAARRAACSGTAEAVEDPQLRRGERELAVLVLAVERQQRAADVAQVGRRGAAAAEVRARAPLGANPPREHELVGVLGRRSRQVARAAPSGSANTPST